MELWHSLKFKLIFFCCILTLGLSLSFGVWLYHTTQTQYRSQQIDHIRYTQENSLLSVSSSFQQLQRYAYLMSNDADISAYLNSLSIYEEDFTYKVVKAVTAVQTISSSNSVRYIDKMMLSSRRHYHCLLSGSLSGSQSDIYDFYRLCPPTDSMSLFPYKISESPFIYRSRESTVLPVKFRVYTNYSKYAGDLYIALNTDFFADAFESFQEYYLILGDYCYYVHDGQFQTVEIPIKEDISAYKSAMVNQGSRPLITAADGTEMILSGSPTMDLYLLNPLPKSGIALPFANVLLDGLLILGIVMFIFFFFYLMMQKFITRPVREIKRQLQQISRGDFSLPGDAGDRGGIREFTEIFVQLDQVSRDLSAMILQLQAEEANKRNYEFRLLQNQIHPHFIYNTLNSIRWLGELNGLPSIVDMTTSLSSMLKKVFRSSSEWTTVSEEVAFIREYAHLQSFRYGDTFRMEYDIQDESLYDVWILRFTLQPLVENAIFHGIEPSRRRGVIQIRIFRDGGDLVLDVRDNGIGMDQTELENLMSHPGHTDQISGIGIRNIHQRIFMEFGAPYGLEIESVKNEFTCIHIRMPLLAEQPEAAAAVQTVKQ